MKYVAKTTDIKPADVIGYGKTETLPSFGAAGNGYALATGLWNTPSVDYYGGAAGVLVGTPGVDGLVVSATNKLVHPTPARTLFNVNNALSYVVIAKVPLTTQVVFGDSFDGTASFSLSINAPTSPLIRAIGKDSSGATLPTADVTLPSNMDTLWTLLFLIGTQTTTQIAYYRAATGLVLGPISSRASTQLGSTTVAPGSGGNTTGGTPGSTILLSQTLLTALTVPQIVATCTEAGRLMSSLGKTL